MTNGELSAEDWATPATLRLAAHVVLRGGAIPAHAFLFEAAANRIEALEGLVAAKTAISATEDER